MQDDDGERSKLGIVSLWAATVFAPRRESGWTRRCSLDGPGRAAEVARSLPARLAGTAVFPPFSESSGAAFFQHHPGAY